MIEISLCMIVKNEEKILARCLDSVADLVDEIVIVDTGSTDPLARFFYRNSAFLISNSIVTPLTTAGICAILPVEFRIFVMCSYIRIVKVFYPTTTALRNTALKDWSPPSWNITIQPCGSSGFWS